MQVGALSQDAGVEGGCGGRGVSAILVRSSGHGVCAVPVHGRRLGVVGVISSSSPRLGAAHGWGQAM